MVTVAIIGIGRWGKNLIRCFDDLAEIAYGCHSGDSSNATWLHEQYPSVTLTEQYGNVLKDDSVDAIVIATPIETHASLTRQALKAGKDVFVEKPLASDATEAWELVDLAKARGRRLFTGYIFLYAPAMSALHEQLTADPAVHIHATWEKFGTFDAPVSESLACHDIAVGQYLFGEQFQDATVVSRTGVRTDTDLLDVSLTTVDGRKMTASYDRTAKDTRKSVVVVTERENRYEFYNDQLYELDSDEHVNITPRGAEPLTAECQAFLDWLRGGDRPPSGGIFGAQINEILLGL